MSVPKQARNSWITCPRPNPQARIRLFCLPFAGGGASAFFNWANELSASVEVCPIQLPGRENRMSETPFTQLTTLVQVLTRVMQPYLDKPFAIFGHSMGAKISYELSRQLSQTYSVLPQHLFVSGSRPPHMPEESPIHQLPEQEFLREVLQFNGTPKTIMENEKLMTLFLPLLRADLTLDETYIYQPCSPLACPITVLGGIEDAEVDHDDLLAWREYTTNSFAVQMFPGDHFFLRSVEKDILRILSASLQKAVLL